MKIKHIIFIFVGFFVFSLIAGQSVSGKTLDKGEEDAFYVAVKAYEDGFYDISLRLFDKFLKTYPDSDKMAEVQVYMGQCYYSQGKFIKALDQFESLLKTEDYSGIRDKVLFWLGEIYVRGRDYQHAIEFYKKVIDNYKDSFYCKPAYFALAGAYIDCGELKDAVKIYSQILETFKDRDVQEQAALGMCEAFYRMRDYKSLQDRIEKFISEYPDSKMLGRAYLYLGESNFSFDRYNEATLAYKSAESVASGDDEISAARLGIGWSYLKLKKYEEAQKIFEMFSDEYQPIAVVLGRAVLKTGLGEFQESLDIFDQVIRNDKSGEYAPLAYFGKAEALYNLSRFDEAIIAYRIALDKVKAATTIYAQAQQLSDKIYYGLAWSYLKIGDFQSAITSFQKAASQSSDRIFKISALCQLGDTYQDAGEYEKAIQTYRNFLSDYPDSVYNDYIQYQIGMTLLKMENMDSAIMAFRKFLSDYPSSKLIDDVNYFLGVTYFQKGDFSAAREQLEKFVKVFNDSTYRSQSLFLFGETLVNLSEYKQAIAIFNEVIKNSRQGSSLNQKSEYEIAKVYAKMGNESEAQKRLADFILRYPDSPMSADIIFWLGQSSFANNNFAQARKYFERLIRNYPGHELVSDAYLQIALTFIEEDKEDSALRSLQKAVETSVNSGIQARALVLTGDIYYSKRDIDKAMEYYKKASSFDTAWRKPAYVKLADILEERNNLNEAVSLLTKALGLGLPGEEDAQIQFKIGELLEEIGAPSEALEAYMKVYYLYPQDKKWSVKALLRVAGIYEGRENWQELKNILEKVVQYDVDESKYAGEKLVWLEDKLNKR